MGCQSFHSKRFSRIMAAVKDVQAQVFSQRISPMWSLAGDERVDAFGRSNFQLSSSAASDNANSPAHLRAAWNEKRLATGCPFQPAGQVLS